MTGNKIDKDLIAFIYVSILAFIAAIYAFSVLPNPQLQRDINFDQKRVTDITELQSQIGNFYTSKAYLPQTIDELINDTSYYGSQSTKDPLSNKIYEYIVLNPTTYQLCADFATDSDTISKYAANDSTYNYPYGGI